MISPEKCPYCFRQLGTWVKDPIFLPNGGPYVWTSDTEIIKEDRIDHRFYKGFYQICEPEVQEIQDFLKAAEVTAGVTITTWSPLNMSGKFQILGKHIKEMRDSVEKLLTLFGLTKTDYFNYDEEGNLITQYGGGKVEWTDPITNAVDLKKFQVKAIHIEDLRHYIQTYWQETWTKQPLDYVPPESDAYPYIVTDSDHQEQHSTPGYWTGYIGGNLITVSDTIHADHIWSLYIYGNQNLRNYQYSSADHYPRTDIIDVSYHFTRDSKINFGLSSALYTNPIRLFTGTSYVYGYLRTSIVTPANYKIQILNLVKTLTEKYTWSYSTGGVINLDYYIYLQVDTNPTELLFWVHRQDGYRWTNLHEETIIDNCTGGEFLSSAHSIAGTHTLKIYLYSRCSVNCYDLTNGYIWADLKGEFDITFDTVKVIPYTP